MSDIRQTVEQYIAIWNETDGDRRRALIGAVWAEDGRYTDPLADACGRAALDALVEAVQGQFPGFVFTLGPVDAHHHLARFTWGLGPAGEEPPVVGFDVLALDDAGLVATVAGFLDRIPSA
ncbi:nuclear transport factor 2 family protein [Kitasatospora sp. NPDC059571]|uniref:nuclear transport factor 2 family protein n=1 Tax=Kitasatospora sp. NPDC059571 TaxID=3346871 RepID=UPI0036794CA1